MSANDTAPTKVGSAEALRNFKLLEALRSTTDANSPDVQELVSLLDSDGSSDATPPLHLAARCASVAIFPLVLQHRQADINVKDRASGQTPLHIACSLGRTDLVGILLAQPDIDDMIVDDTGRTCLECAASAEPARLIQVSRATFNATYLDLLGKYISSGNSAELSAWLTKPRARCIDFAAKVPTGSKGTTLLHEAARRKDAKLIQLALERGADVLAKDGRGKTASDFTKDPEIRNLFKKAAVVETKNPRNSVNAPTLTSKEAQPQVPNESNNATTLPERRGYLSKWTALSKGGYKQRWFVLANGQLSYYRHQSEQGKSSRGSIAMASAKVHTHVEDKLKFEISSQIAKYKFYVKADHPLEASRWVEDLKMHIQGNSNVQGGSTLPTPSSEYGDQSSFPFGHSASSASLSNLPKSEQDPALNRKASARWSLKMPQMSRMSKAPKEGGETFVDGMPPNAMPSSAPSIAPSIDDRETASIVTFAHDESGGAPHEDNFVLLGNSARAQVESVQQLLASLAVADQSAAALHTNALDVPAEGNKRPASVASTMSLTPSRQLEVRDALKQSVNRLGVMLEQYMDMVADRERYFMARYEHEVDTKGLWEQSMQEIAASHAQLEQQLERTTTKAMVRKKELRAFIANSPSVESDTATPTLASAAAAGGAVAPASALSRDRRPTLTAGDLSDDSDDEFYEAVETGAVPLQVDTAIASPSVREWPANYKPTDDKLAEFEGYKNLRTKLPISVDDRPSVSLWGILKNSIGKDLTKIRHTEIRKNEPTSMLERMAEDMEFSECLDAAVKQEDSTLRIAYVAAFAMSNYSSTIGRIAKPFNPMLGETFEYVSFDKQYRYMSEQVSHHPPMSACICQSPTWHYYGEVDAKSKFLGKSFEIRPTGIAHCKLFLPKEWAPDQEARGDGLVPEHYSWKKVTTSVSNFIMGSPTIDHYGDMIVTNHRTGEKCVLTFKPRGWRASNACELKGQVTNSAGRVVWDLAGRWNAQLVARRAGAGSGELQPDTNADSSKEYVLLWKNSVKPERSPFNLTPYAITLNDKNDALVPWLPPTDCRLRPDLHAFESGYFEKANDFKTGLEEFQRGTRRKRETGEMPPHAPRWFTRETDKDSGERYWQWKVDATATPEYWAERERAGKATKAGQKTEWNGVDHIFGDFELL